MTEHETHPVDLLPELALGVTPERDAASLKEHLASCETCREEYAEIERVAQLLPFAVDNVEPPPALRDSLFERIRTEPRALPTRLPMRLPLRWVAGLAASAAALLVVGALVGAMFFGTDDGDLRRAADRQATLVQAFAQGNASMTSGRDESSGASAVLLRAPGTDEAYLWLSNLPPLPAGKAYQAWFIRDGKAEPSDVFKDAQGGVWISAEDAIDRFAAMGLTIEDDSGSATPSSAPFLALDLQKSVRR